MSLAWVPAVTSLNDGVCHRNIRWDKPFPLQVAFGSWWFILARDTRLEHDFINPKDTSPHHLRWGGMSSIETAKGRDPEGSPAPDHCFSLPLKRSLHHPRTPLLDSKLVVLVLFSVAPSSYNASESANQTCLLRRLWSSFSNQTYHHFQQYHLGGGVGGSRVLGTIPSYVGVYWRSSA